MNSATTMLLALVPAGGHIVTTTDCYRRTRQFIQTVLPKMGISTTVIDPADMDGLERALKENTVSLFFSGDTRSPLLLCLRISDTHCLQQPSPCHAVAMWGLLLPAVLRCSSVAWAMVAFLATSPDT